MHRCWPLTCCRELSKWPVGVDASSSCVGGSLWEPKKVESSRGVAGVFIASYKEMFHGDHSVAGRYNVMYNDMLTWKCFYLHYRLPDGALWLCTVIYRGCLRTAAVCAARCLCQTGFCKICSWKFHFCVCVCNFSKPHEIFISLWQPGLAK